MPYLSRKKHILFGLFVSIGLAGITSIFNENIPFNQPDQLESTASKLNTEANLNSVLNSEKLPVATENFPVGTLVIPMDNTLQGRNNSAGGFNLLAYGLAVRLLHAEIPLKWTIRPNKGKDEADYWAKVKQIAPSNGSSSWKDFRGGPIIIYPGFENLALNIINNYNNSIIPGLPINGNYKVKVNVYEITESANLPVAHSLLHKPKGAILNNGGNGDIHKYIYQYAGLSQNTHYAENVNANDLNSNSCYTFASEAHLDNVSSATASKVKQFLQGGGNFLAQCAAVKAYASQNLLSSYHSKNGGSGIYYANSSEMYAQYHGALADEGGSVTSFKLTSNPGSSVTYKTDNYHKAYVGRISNPNTPNGGYVHYLAGHDYDSGGLGYDNGYRLFLNALLTPVTRPSNCNLNLCSNVTNAGSISGGGNWCTPTPSISITIPVISNSASASGGSGGSIQYQWQRKINNGNWTDVPGATLDKYNPPNNGYTIGSTRYRRRAKRTCSNIWIISNEVLVYIQQIFSNAGSIGSNQTNCGSYNPANISGSNPSGGGGNPAEYQWQYRTTGGWININNATGASYDPGNINVTTQYRRGARRIGCYNPLLYSNTVTKTVNNVAINLVCEYKINGTYWVQNDCAVDICIGNKLELSVNPNGLSSYAWTGPNGFSYNSNNSSDVLISNNITTTMAGTYTAIATDANGCSGVKQFTINVTSSYTNPGSISSNQSNCGSYNPANITGSNPSGGSGGGAQYQWQYRTNGSWININNANAANYDPGNINLTTQYRRGAKRSDCTSFIYSNTITKIVDQPIAIPGSIDGGNTYCGSGDPSIISSSSPASGGIGGNIIYQWQYRNGTSGNWSNVSGATGLTYDPPTLTSTRQYRRAAKRTTCGDWIYSNITTFIVNNNPITQPATLVSCDIANGSGIGQFILSDAFSQIIVNLTNIEITFHNTLFDAQNGIPQIISPFTSASTTIFYRIQNTSTNCFEINTITLNVGNICLENCTNEIDEDGDGLIDCDDPDCACCQAKIPTLIGIRKKE